MTEQQYLRNLCVPHATAEQPIDVVLDTDAYNEIDDQFAIAYLLRSPELRTLALYAAPFFNEKSTSPADGMEKSYDEIGRLLGLLGVDRPVYRGAPCYLPDEHTPVESPAARDLVRLAGEHTPAQPLYVVAIGAITNVASALLMDPRVAENCVVVWLGGHARHFHDTTEFNMVQDIAAARVVFGSGVPLVQLPCAGVVSAFTVSRSELECFLKDHGALADDLAANTIAAAERYAAGQPWTRVIWDVTAVAWLKNAGDRFLLSRVVPAPMPTYDRQYEDVAPTHPMRYVYYVHRDALMSDLFRALGGG